MKRDTNNSSDDEFGVMMSEEEFNRKHMKALAQADPYNFKQRKRKKRIPKEKPNPFRGLGGSSSRGPWPR